MGRRTNDHWGDLCNLAHIVIGLHDALYPRDREVVLDGDVVGIGWQCGRAAGAIASVAHGRQRDIWYVVCILHALLVGHAARHIGGRRYRVRVQRRAGGGGREGCGVRN